MATQGTNLLPEGYLLLTSVLQESLELDFESGFQLYQDFELRSQVRISRRSWLNFQSELLAVTVAFWLTVLSLIILAIYSFYMLKTVRP